jgi:hypothetical protein
LRSGSTWTPYMLRQHLCRHDIAIWPSFTPQPLPHHVFTQIKQQIQLLLKSVHGSPQVVTDTNSDSTNSDIDGDDNTCMSSLLLSNESSSRLFLDALVLPIAAHCGIVMDVESTEKRQIYPTNRRDYVFGISPLRYSSLTKPSLVAVVGISTTSSTPSASVSTNANEEKDNGLQTKQLSSNFKRLLPFVLLEAKQRKALADMVLYTISHQSRLVVLIDAW